jgi:hypothetical protein
MKKLILETLSLYQEDLIIEKLLKKYLYLKEKKDGGLLIKLIKNDKVLIFDPSIEEELDLLYDHLYPIVINSIEYELGKEHLSKLNTKRIYDLLETMINRVIKIFKSKNNNKKIDNTVEKYVLNKLEFVYYNQRTDYLKYDGLNSDINTHLIKNIYQDPPSDYDLNKFFTPYRDLILQITKDLSTKLGLTYRESKNGIISAIDKAVKKYINSFIRSSDKNLSDIIRSYRKID